MRRLSGDAVIERREPRAAGGLRGAKNTLIFVLASAVVAICKGLPYRVLCALGRGVGAMAWVVAPTARETAIENVRTTIALGDRGRARAIARATYRRLGALLGDTIDLAGTRQRASSKLPIGAMSRAVLVDAIAEGRGVVLVTAHFGSWERLAAVLVECGARLVTPVRRSYDARLEARIVEPLRARHGVTTLDRDAPTTPLQLARALKRGDVVGILVDLNTRTPSIRAPFLGRSARTTVAPARLAIARGAAVVCAMATRDGVVIERVRSATTPNPRSSPEPVRTLTEAINARIGEAIAREPESWIWMHPRWAEAPAGSTGDLDERALTAPSPPCEVARPPNGDGA
ncbi:MAG: lysophospholipid acyltransferase family protein [Polyangiales bacterium]